MRPYSFYGSIRAVIERGDGDKPAVSDERDTFTFRELASAVDVYAEKLKTRGIGRGSHVALWALNSIGWLTAFLAIEKLKAVAVLCNYSLTIGDLEPLLKKTDVSFILYGANQALSLDKEAPQHLGAKLGLDAERVLSFMSENFRQYAKMPLSDNFTEITEQESKERPALIIFTTGSTSEPKAVLLSQYGMLTSNMIQPQVVPDLDKRSSCIAVPLFHCMALLTTFNMLVNGRPVLLLESFSADHILDVVPRHHMTALVTVNTVHFKLIEDDRFKHSLSKTITSLGSGGGALTEAQYLRIETAYDNARLLNGYAQSESGGVLAVASPNDPLEIRTHTVGKPIPGKDVRIKDPVKGFVPQGEMGEIVVGNHGDLMLGYYGLPKEDQPFDEEGFLHTGDIGYLDEDGYLVLAGRIKDIIIKGGENISPLEVERALTEIPNIREAKVIGMPHPIYGENVEAAVTCIDSAAFGEQDIKSKVRSAVGSFKVPAHILLFDSFPLNANNKLDQRSLKLDMIRRLRDINTREELDKGITLVEMKLTNKDFMIVPTADIIESVAQELGFHKHRAAQIRLSCEEMLTERIINAYADVGSVELGVILTPEFMRVRFSDSGLEYDIHRNEKTNLSARLILKYVDGFTTVSMTANKKAYCMDFVFEEEFDVVSFLVSHTKGD